jgi:hypothetical protein
MLGLPKHAARSGMMKIPPQSRVFEGIDIFYSIVYENNHMAGGGEAMTRVAARWYQGIGPVGRQ